MIQDHTIALLFDSFDLANKAKDALRLEQDVAADRVRIDVREDEAGPVKGNFVMGNKNRDGKQTGDYAEQYADPAIDGAVTLYVQCSDAGEAAALKSAAMMLGGKDVESRIPPTS